MKSAEDLPRACAAGFLRPTVRQTNLSIPGDLSGCEREGLRIVTYDNLQMIPGVERNPRGWTAS